MGCSVQEPDGTTLDEIGNKVTVPEIVGLPLRHDPKDRDDSERQGKRNE